MKPIIKVCGMTQGQNIRDVEALGVDLIGFIFYEKSPRCARQLPDYLPLHAGRVGVFVDAPLAEINAKAKAFGLTHIQLHGHESPQLCQTLKGAGFKVIKAFSIAEPCDLNATEAYDGICDYFLFDTKTPAYGEVSRLRSRYSTSSVSPIHQKKSPGIAKRFRDFSVVVISFPMSPSLCPPLIWL